MDVVKEHQKACADQKKALEAVDKQRKVVETETAKLHKLKEALAECGSLAKALEKPARECKARAAAQAKAKEPAK